jgi:hypothetical protein
MLQRGKSSDSWQGQSAARFSLPHIQNRVILKPPLLGG